jgi:hypothetical protein
VLAVPMVGAGLSFNGDISVARRLAMLLIAGSIYGWLVCSLWPEEKVTARARAELPRRAVMTEYGVRLGFGWSSLRRPRIAGMSLLALPRLS